MFLSVVTFLSVVFESVLDALVDGETVWLALVSIVELVVTAVWLASVGTYVLFTVSFVLVVVFSFFFYVWLFVAVLF